MRGSVRLLMHVTTVTTEFRFLFFSTPSLYPLFLSSEGEWLSHCHKGGETRSNASFWP